jgi:cytochrome d ubiquinol oxidase subunit I
LTELFAARTQMAVSLGFHIVFAAIGMSMPFLMAVSHWRWLKTKDPAYLKLTKAWSQGVAIFFAVGAVSGTALSFELGLLWPKFMELAGPIIGMPFSWEGTAFFIEAIFIGIFLYGWDRVPAFIHWLSGLLVGLSGLASAFFVICANGWMNSPAGFDWVKGQAVNIDPWAAMFNRSALPQGLHMALASFTATGFAVAGIHALGLLKNPKSALHLKAFRIALLFGSLSAVLLPLQGDFLARRLVTLQPAKFAAMEALYQTSAPAPLMLGGIPSDQDQRVRYGIEIPGALSFLAHGDLYSEVKGLDKIPQENRPPVAPTHWAFDLMAGIGSLLFSVGLFTLFASWKKSKWMTRRLFLKLSIFCLPLGFIAIEAGWTVTEVGRQPWIIYGILKTQDAVTSTPGLFYSMLLFTALYLFLSFVVTWLMVRRFRHVD